MLDMDQLDTKNVRVFANFLSQLAKDMTRFYYLKLNKPFKAMNKSKGKGYDPVTKADMAFEKFIRSKIKKKFPNHEIIGEEFGYKKTKSDFTWVIDPIDGTRSFIVGNPTWSNLIALNYKGNPTVGLANFPRLSKYYLNYSNKTAYVVNIACVGKDKKKKLSVNKKATFKTAKVAGAFHGWLSLKKPTLAGFIIALPLISIIALAFSYLEHRDLDKSIIFAKSILVGVPVSLFFFIPFFFAKTLELKFATTYGLGIMFLVLGFFLHKFITDVF